MWCKVLFFLTDEMVEAMKRVHRIIHSRMAFSVGHSGFLSLASPCLFEQGMQTFGNSRTNTRYNQKKLPTPSVKIESLNELNFTHVI